MSIPSDAPAATAGPGQQAVDWPDRQALAHAQDHLRAQPGLVTAEHCEQLREQLAAAACGQAFVLHGGDCAEEFSQVLPEVIRAKLRTLLQMALVLTYAGSVPVVKVGRMAGQYAKPRSQLQETRNGVSLPAYRGDMVNGQEFTATSRTPDPQRLVQAYEAARQTLSIVARLLDDGLADLDQVQQWNAGFVHGSPAMAAYEQMATQIERALAFMRACRVDSPQFHQVQVFASHEALVLEYERALTRVTPQGRAYASSGHLLWVGERTRDPQGAHLAYAASIANPVAVKLGPTTTPEDVQQLTRVLNPDALPGRLSLITRLGAGQVQAQLPALVQAVSQLEVPVVWMCDPMHGNTFTTDTGRKTRRFDDVVQEVAQSAQVHRQLGSWLGGISVELTGSDVTECVGGAHELTEQDLEQRYETACDPRLNHSQALELAFLLAETLHQDRRG